MFIYVTASIFISSLSLASWSSFLCIGVRALGAEWLIERDTTRFRSMDLWWFFIVIGKGEAGNINQNQLNRRVFAVRAPLLAFNLF